MGFADRAVEACRRDWSEHRVDENHVRDVLKSRLTHALWAFEYTEDDYPAEVRVAAARVLTVGSSGRMRGHSALSIRAQEGTRATTS